LNENISWIEKASLQYNERKFEKCEPYFRHRFNVARDSKIWIDEQGMNKDKSADTDSILKAISLKSTIT
jgi:hypothetical protein